MLRHLAIATAIALGSAVAVTPACAQSASNPQPSGASSPQAIVEDIVRQLDTQIGNSRAKTQYIAQTQGNKEQVNKKKLDELIDTVLLPHFDTAWASILVLGTHAPEATPEQRARFAKAFYKSLINRYADGLLSYTNGTVKILPSRDETNTKTPVVRTQVKTSDNKPIAVNFVFHRATDGQWKAYDIIVEGISYIISYRNQIDGQIKKEGLDKLISELEKRGDKALEQMDQQNKGNKAHGAG